VKHRYLIFYKPYGVLSQFTDPDGTGHPTLSSYIDVPGVYTAGRLDHDSEGLLLLTTDGVMQHKLTDPKFEHPRTYLAQVEGIPTKEALARLLSGVDIKGYRARAVSAELLAAEPSFPPRTPPIRIRKEIPTAWLQLTLTEGRNRQVRRMTAAVGFPTLRLIRIAIGRLGIDNLKPGEWRDVPARAIRV
jgi:23S rRNA pseudouridine2457 synthase